MAYEFESRVRYSEVDASGYLKWTALVNYLQDCSTFQSEDLGLGVFYLGEKGMAWVLNYWQIDLLRLPRLTDYIIIGTKPIEIRGFMGTRNFYIRDKKTGEYLVKAYSVWTLLDMKAVRPVKATQEMLDGYVCEEKLRMEYLSRKITLEGEPRKADPIEIVESMLDTNRHVNNEQYIQLALSCAQPERSIRRLRAEYKESAFLGDILCPDIYEMPGDIGVAFTKKGETEPCMKCQFVYEEDLKIQPATEADTDELLALYRTQIGGLAAWDEHYPSRETIAFDLSREALFVMKNEAQEIVAAISIDQDEAVEQLPCWNPDCKPVAELSRVCVREDMKNRSLAKRMMRYVFDVLKAKGYQGVHILVKTEHVIALQSYHYLGFREVGSCHLFDRDFVCLEMALA